MNRIVLIGNGFDLAHGLNTKYEDSDVQNISRNFTDMKLMRDRVVSKTYVHSNSKNFESVGQLR